MGIAKKLYLPFNPDKLEDFAMTFYNAATREPAFSYTYLDGEEEYTCDCVLSDIMGLWIKELTGISREEIEGI